MCLRKDCDMTFQDAKILIKAIKDSDRPIPAWESDFLRSISRQIRVGVRISPLQSNKLQEIYRLVSGGGIYEGRQYIS